MPKDLLGREISKGDYVVFHNLLYEVKEVNERTTSFGHLDRRYGQASILIELVEKSKTTRPKRKMSNETCLVSKGEVTKWLLTRNN